MTETYKYKAFITYSHADEKWASWLHKALEAYRPPKGLVGRDTPYGPVPKRIGSVFRDREELATATNLGDKLTQALEDSACQIVICSPQAAKSNWTNEEIKTYKRLGRSHRIFALIVDGEPGASANPETVDDECFAPALIYEMGDDGELTDVRGEPIAADARPGKDSKQSAKLKLLAGMLGVAYDDLAQREVHRRQRRMMLLTTAGFIGMTITSGLAVTAYLARIEADEQRKIAEIKAETARQTTDFMVDLFEVSDPSEALGNTITARDILDKGASRIETDLAEQPEIQATLMDTIGTVYKNLGLYDPATLLVSRALERRITLFGEDHVDVAQSLSHLGKILALRAEYDEAERNLREALETQRSWYGDTHPEVADTLSSLADVLTRKGKYEAAEPLIRKALTIRRSYHSDVHADIAESLEDLGLNYFDQGNFEQAIAELRGAVNMRRELHGEVHPALATSMTNLTWALLEFGKYDEAETLAGTILDMKRRIYGEAHPEIAMELNNLAYILEMKNDLRAAERRYRDALEMSRQIYGEVHPDIALVLSNLTIVTYQLGDVDQAIEIAREALAMYRDVLGSEHPTVAASATSLGYWLTQQGEYEEAEKLLDEAIAIRKAALGDLHPDLASSLTYKSYFLLETERFDDARAIAHEAREMLLDRLPADHWRVAAAATVEGAALTRLDDYEKAERLLLDSIEPLTQAPIPGLADQNRKRLVALYLAWGKPEQAADYRP